jgi:hypothetical protein
MIEAPHIVYRRTRTTPVRINYKRVYLKRVLRYKKEMSLACENEVALST